MKSFRIEKAAELELFEAAIFYEENEPGLGGDFYNSVNSAFKLICRAPEIWQKTRGEIRRYILNDFPYSILYHDGKDCVTIYAVMHHKREPRYWVDRLND